ncbi:hypothetical protein BDQ17DRAFT_1407068 [Cyathus striatus]|nr:hypothetical protein BDQ17DRAFT_1407068 [Cyathus striatus]
MQLHSDDGLTINSTCLEYYSVMRIKPWVYGNIFSGIIYGANFVLFVAYVQLLRRQYPKVDVFTRPTWIQLLYSTLTFILCTLSIISALLKTVDVLTPEFFSVCLIRDETEFVNAIPGGDGITIWANMCFLLVSWMADGLLIWRCLTIYQDVGRWKWLIASVSFLLQVGSIVLIIARLFILRYRVRKALGTGFGCEYTNVAAMLTESQAMTLLAQSCMVTLIMYAGDNGGIFAAYQILAQIQALAPMLILYRVIQGKAWCRNTFAEATKPDSYAVA